LISQKEVIFATKEIAKGDRPNGIYCQLFNEKHNKKYTRFERATKWLFTQPDYREVERSTLIKKTRKAP